MAIPENGIQDIGDVQKTFRELDSGNCTIIVLLIQIGAKQFIFPIAPPFDFIV